MGVHLSIQREKTSEERWQLENPNIQPHHWCDGRRQKGINHNIILSKDILRTTRYITTERFHRSIALKKRKKSQHHKILQHSKR